MDCQLFIIKQKLYILEGSNSVLKQPIKLMPLLIRQQLLMRTKIKASARLQLIPILFAMNTKLIHKMDTSLKCSESEILKLQICKKVKLQLFFFNMDYSHLLILGLVILQTNHQPLSMQTMDTMFGLEIVEEISIRDIIKVLIQLKIRKFFIISVLRNSVIMICQHK